MKFNLFKLNRSGFQFQPGYIIINSLKFIIQNYPPFFDIFIKEFKYLPFVKFYLLVFFGLNN